MVIPRTSPPTQIPYGTDELLMPAPVSTTSSELPVAPRMPTSVNVPFTYSASVSVYEPGAISIVVFERSAATAALSWLAVDTRTTVPAAGASGGAGRTGAAAAGAAAHRNKSD